MIRRWGRGPLRGWRRRGERGGSQSILLLGVVVALVLSAGLVVDGGRKTAAARDAEAVAAGAARAGLNAGATGRLAGRANTTAAVSAARSFLAGAPERVRICPTPARRTVAGDDPVDASPPATCRSSASTP